MVGLVFGLTAYERLEYVTLCRWLSCQDEVACSSCPSSELVVFVCRCRYCVSVITDAKDIYTAVRVLHVQTSASQRCSISGGLEEKMVDEFELFFLNPKKLQHI